MVGRSMFLSNQIYWRKIKDRIYLPFNSKLILARVREVPLKYGVQRTTRHPKNGVPIIFFSESSVCVRVMKCSVPCTLWHIKNGVPLCENGVQIIFFLPYFWLYLKI